MVMVVPLSRIWLTRLAAIVRLTPPRVNVTSSYAARDSVCTSSATLVLCILQSQVSRHAGRISCPIGPFRNSQSSVADVVNVAGDGPL